MPTSKETQPLPYRLSAFVYPLTAASLAECLRRHAGLFAEKSREVRGIGKSQIVGNLVDRLRGKHELALGFRKHALADQMTSRSFRKFSSSSRRNSSTRASARVSVTVPERARLTASRTTSIAISASSPRMARR